MVIHTIRSYQYDKLLLIHFMTTYIDSNRKITIGKRIKTWRKQRKLTQEKFAFLIDRTADAISMIERGINFPARETLEKMSKVLNIPLKEFLFNDEENIVNSERETIIEQIVGLLHKLDDKSLKMALRHVEVLGER